MKKLNYKKECVKFLKLGLPPLVFIGNVMPVHLGVRKINFCFEDQLLIDNFKRAHKIGKKLWKKYQIMMIPIVVPYGEDAIKILFFTKDNKKLSELDDLQELLIAKNKIGKDPFGDLEIIEKIGKLLYYPECCVKNFKEIKKKKRNIEIETSKKLKKDKSNKEIFFAYEFYPCSFSCKKSIKIGRKILSTLEKEDSFLGESFKIILDMNYDKLKNIFERFEDRFANKMNWDGKIYKLAKQK